MDFAPFVVRCETVVQGELEVGAPSASRRHVSHRRQRDIPGLGWRSHDQRLLAARSG
jgi:hypothetical protein